VANAVDICNLALALLGDEASLSSIDPPEGSAQADHCARFYPMALDTMLDSHYWSFCTSRATLNLLTITPAFGWTYAYAEPTNSINIIGLFNAGSVDDQNPQQFEIEALADGTTVIYANIQNPIARYTLRVVDPAKFQPLFVDALVDKLASLLAGPILKGDTGAKMAITYRRMFTESLAQAKASDAAQRKVTLRHNPDFLAARGAIPVSAIGDDNPGAWVR
jgi:hypothetical protein